MARTMGLFYDFAGLFWVASSGVKQNGLKTSEVLGGLIFVPVVQFNVRQPRRLNHGRGYQALLTKRSASFP